MARATPAATIAIPATASGLSLKARPAALTPVRPSLSETTKATPPKPGTSPAHCRSATIDALRNAVSSISATTPAGMPLSMARNTPDR